MEYTVQHSGSYFEITITGAADVNGFVALVDSILEHEDWKPGTPILVDETAFDASQISVEGVRSIANAYTRRGSEFGEARVATFVTCDLEFGIDRMWMVFVEDQWDVSSNVFRSRGEAIDWLSV